ncbi:MAG: DNA repair and recombination protein RadA [Nanoarchaeota archaeon]
MTQKTIMQEKDITVQELPGVGEATAEKLALAGFDSVMAIAVATPGQIVTTAGMSESGARKLIQFSRAALNLGFQTGEDAQRMREQILRIPTGSKQFDDMLGGGFETGCISECFGQYGSSKTQIAFSLAVQCLKTHEGSSVVYIDTENTFRPDRIVQIANAVGIEPEDALRRIRVARAYNSDHQMLLAEKVSELIRDGLDVKLLIIDSLTAHFRAEFVGRGTLAERQQKINKHMHVLARLASMHNLAVYVTNQVMAKPDQFFGDPTEAIGGHIVGHNSTFRIYLRKGKKGTRVAKLIDSPNLPDAEAVFLVTDAGVIDA